MLGCTTNIIEQLCLCSMESSYVTRVYDEQEPLAVAPKVYIYIYIYVTVGSVAEMQCTFSSGIFSYIQVCLYF
jgi:hypothetical protein